MINTWNESQLHEDLKNLYNGKKEVPIDGFICDVETPDKNIIEIQTKHLSALKEKLEKLLVHQRVTIIHPIPISTLIETYTKENILKTQRKSPKHGTIYDLFPELTKIYHLLENENLTITVLFVEILEIRKDDGEGSWRRKGISIVDKKLIQVKNTQSFCGLHEYLSLIPKNVGDNFTTADLKKTEIGNRANITAWVLYKMNLIERVGKIKNAYLYAIKPKGL